MNGKTKERKEKGSSGLNIRTLNFLFLSFRVQNYNFKYFNFFNEHIYPNYLQKKNRYLS